MRPKQTAAIDTFTRGIFARRKAPARLSRAAEFDDLPEPATAPCVAPPPASAADALGRTPQPVVDRIYDLVERVDHALRAHDIPYVISSGTLLGAVRHGGLIPWDDDADISIRASDAPRLAKLRPRLAAQGLILDTTIYGHHRMMDAEYPVGAKKRHVPFVDIFHVAKDGYYEGIRARWYWPKDRTPFEAFENPALIPFGHLTLPAPQADDREAILTEAYGDKWREVAKRMMNHTGDAIEGTSRAADLTVMPPPALHSQFGLGAQG